MTKALRNLALLETMMLETAVDNGYSCFEKREVDYTIKYAKGEARVHQSEFEIMVAKARRKKGKRK